MRWRFIYYFGILASVPAFGGRSNVFGVDHRRTLPDGEFPGRVVGFLSTSCAGTLVGRRLVLTAAHCTLLGEGGERDPALTTFSLTNSEGIPRLTAAITKVWRGTVVPKAERGKDWALLELDQPLGTEVGFIKVRESELDEVSLIGFSASVPNLHEHCHIRERLWDRYLHDCDNTRGASGGPIYFRSEGEAYLMAVNVAEYRKGEASEFRAEYSRDFANIAVPARAFLPKLKALLAGED